MWLNPVERIAARIESSDLAIDKAADATIASTFAQTPGDFLKVPRNVSKCRERIREK